MPLSLLLESGYLFLEHSKALVQNFVLTNILTVEINLMLKSFISECPYISLGLCEGLLLVQDKAVLRVMRNILTMVGAVICGSLDILGG